MLDLSANKQRGIARTGGHILIVEDDSRILRLERFILEDDGFLVREAGSGEEALEALEARPPDLVLLDIGLPGMDGFATCQRIRECSQVPIIMVTAEDKDHHKVRGLELGADDYVTKPFSTTELMARVKAVLRRHDLSSGDTAAPNETPARSGPMAPAADAGPVIPLGGAELPTGELKNGTFHEGTVRLVVKTSGCVKGMIHFVEELRQSSRFHLLRMIASPDVDAMDILVRLREPVHLEPTLLEMGNVCRVEEVSPRADEQQVYVYLREDVVGESRG